MSFVVPTSFEQAQSTYEPVPADNHIGILIGVTELGTHMESYQGGPVKPVRKVRLQWELPGVTRTDGQSATISAKYNYSLHEKANFRKMLDGWLGASWPEKFKGQSWAFLLGLPALVNVELKPDKSDPNRTFSIVQSVAKLPKGMPVPEPSRSTFFLDLSQKHLPAELSLRDAELIRESREYRAGGFTDDAPRPNGNGNGGGYGNGNGNGNNQGGHGNGHGQGQPSYDPNLPPATTPAATDEDDDKPPF